ncbi:MAG: DUF169 domain-containing protein [Methanobrevibacter sp.]|uniref:DUF169 domain-containing protein n=1 Tax=Methanobrevibacter sp. TaxID=66852 RepID=UPI0025ED6721|nr:DUF169 domain-containing protein [Methanobrevibacter sp.]MBQ6100000.1 DUF169 domain-containing protein [Methanobrevibacter sp.]
MISNIANEMDFKFPPIVLLKSDVKPDDAIGPKHGKGGCVMSFVAQTIAKRKTTCFGRENITCGGISSGFGWGSGLEDEDRLDFQASFLSCGVDSAPNREEYEKKLEYLSKPTREMFKEGERIFSDFETAKTNIKNRPLYDEGQYVIFKGLENLEDSEIPKSVIFIVNPVELTALIQINTSFRTKDAYLLTPQASACQAIGNYVFRQEESDDPKPVLGPIDFAGKRKMKHFIPSEYLTLAMPWKLFLKLEEVSKKSVLQTGLWKKFKKA